MDDASQPQSQVIVRVFGGLGNQMFQYAAGRALSLRLGTALSIDLRSPDSAAHNGYELSKVFQVKAPKVNDEATRRLLGWRGGQRAQRLLRKLKVHADRYACEPQLYAYWPRFEHLASPVYLDGYWQSHLYFAPIEPSLRRDFEFRQPLSGANLSLAQQIAATEHAASVHVRRGDYLATPKAVAHHGTCSTDYYARAISYLNGKFSGTERYFVFSDDIDWARQHLPLPQDTVFVNHNRGQDSHFDMQLMARCRHNIIANSSFSWWAAWLNGHADKVVIAPERWVLAPCDTTTLTPPDWLRLP